MEIFFWVTSLLIPIITILIGLFFTYHPPKEINSLYGYRTARSMASQEAWDAAHSISGRVYLRLGLAITAIVITINLLVPISSDTIMFIDLGIGLIGVISPIFYVEKKLKENETIKHDNQS